MGIPSIKIESLHRYTINDLLDIQNKSKSKFVRALISAVIMRYNGVSTDTIVNILCKSRVIVLKYLHLWNEKGIDSLIDNRSGSESSFTDEMRKDLYNTLKNNKPSDFGSPNPHGQSNYFRIILLKSMEKNILLSR